MATKKKPTEMTPWQRVTMLVRTEAHPAVIQSEVKKLLTDRLEKESRDGPAGLPIDPFVAVWSLASALSKLAMENETLKRRLRRDTRRGSKKPAGELMKKETEPSAQQGAS